MSENENSQEAGHDEPVVSALAVEWSWEGPENPYWLGTHKERGITVGMIEYIDCPEAGEHVYFRMDINNAFGAATMQAVAIKITELENEMGRLRQAATAGVDALIEADEMKAFFGSH